MFKTKFNTISNTFSTDFVEDSHIFSIDFDKLGLLKDEDGFSPNTEVHETDKRSSN